MTTARTKRTTSRLVDWLHDLEKAQDRGTLAALRRGLLLEPHQFYELFRVVPAWVVEGKSRAEVERQLMVAALFAFHRGTFATEQLEERWRNLGESLRELARRRAVPDEDGKWEIPEALKRRMDALLAAHSDDLFSHLRQMIRMLAAEDIPVDWDALLSDIRRWDSEDRRVQWGWSRSFYVGHREVEGGEADVS